ncbi:MAG: hypothetical protein LAT67_06570 [Balneolales bacterium]|nr:hypothetical protein [Balneolales bacterium]
MKRYTKQNPNTVTRLPGMQKYIKILIMSFGAIFFLGAEVYAQSGGFAGAYTRMGYGPRGIGMGNAMTAVYHNSIYAHYNPALASRITKPQFDIAASSMSFDRSLNMASGSFFLPPNAGLSFGLLHAGVSDFDGRTTSGLPTGDFSTNELSAFLAFGLNPGKRLGLGFSAKLFHANFSSDIDNPLGFGIDIGFIYQATEFLSIAGTVQDIFSSYAWNASPLFGGSLAQRTDNFPTRYKLGAAYNFPQTGLLVSTEFETRTQRSNVVMRTVDPNLPNPVTRRSTEEIITGSSQYRAGAEYDLHERVQVRTGLQINDLTNVSETVLPSAGFSLWLPLRNFNSYIDYAFVREPEGIAYMHMFGLRIEL